MTFQLDSQLRTIGCPTPLPPCYKNHISMASTINMFIPMTGGLDFKWNFIVATTAHADIIMT
jgi:hypothetical protein